MIKQKKSFIERIASHKYSEYIMYLISFSESSFFPLPPDPILISLSVINKNKIYRYVALCIISSVVGGILGYIIGSQLFSTFGVKILSMYKCEKQFFSIVQQFNEFAFLIISLKGLTPIPFKIITIASGVAHVPFHTFLIASIIARGSRFLVVGLVCHYWGDTAKHIIEKYQKTSIFLLIFITILGCFLIFFI